MVSMTKYSPVAPFSYRKEIPAAAVTSVNVAAAGAEDCPRSTAVTERRGTGEADGPGSEAV